METNGNTPIPLSRRLVTFLAVLALGNFTAYANEIVTLRHEAKCILRAVADHLGIALCRGVPTPEVRYSSMTPLSEFQIAAESVSHMRPNAVCNSYFAGRNLIFLTDNPAYYQKGRTLDDALAHEYTHFIQVRYGTPAAREDDERKEREAVQVQLWFRETFMSDPSRSRNPCITGLRFPRP